MEIKDLKINIINYCNKLNLPKTLEELSKFKKLFEHKWEQEIKTINIIDVLTFKKHEYNVDYHTFSIEFDENEVLSQNNDIIKTTHTFSCLDYTLFENIKNLNENDKIKINCNVKHISILNRRIHTDNSLLISIHFNLISFEIVEKYNHEVEFEKLENSLKKTETISNTTDTFINNSLHNNTEIKSFNNLLNKLIELDELKFKSSESKTDLNHFQNEVYNKKNLEEFERKKLDIKNYNGLEFKTISTIHLISKDNIEFKVHYKNKTFWLNSKKYKEELQKTTFFLKEKSSVEIDFKIKDTRNNLTSIEIDLVTIKPNHKVKLFGTYIKLEYFWLGIYIFLFIISTITLSKINSYEITSFLIKLTLWILFGYTINKVGVKYINKN